jgi:hypothetical protein
MESAFPRLAAGMRKEAWAILPRFDDAKDFAANGLARVKVNGKWGYIDEKGEAVILPRFDEAEGFAANGLAVVRVNDKYGYIRIPPKYRTPR